MKKFSAFTLAETIVTTAILGFIAASVFVIMFRSSNVSDKKIELMSKNFYNNIYNGIEEMSATNNNFAGIKNTTSEELMNYFKVHLDGQDTQQDNPESCSDLVSGSASVLTYVNKGGMKCAKFSSFFTAGFYTDSACAESVIVKGYRTKNKGDSKVISGACGYIIYEPYGSKGILGEDLFIIALGNKHLK